MTETYIDPVLGEVSEEAPHGYMIDAVTGLRRPRKKRPPLRGPDGKILRRDPPPPEITAPKDEDAPGPEEDTPPGGTRPPRAAMPRLGRRRPAPRKPVGMPRPGYLAKAVNKLYRRAGKAIRAFDPGIGDAFILISRNTADEGDPDDSVGAAWEELARVNPRVRAALVKMLAGGAWGMLIEAHLPVVAAILVKDAVRRRVPFGRLVASMATPDEDSPPGGGGLPFGMTMDDAQAVARTFADTFPDFGGGSMSPYPPQQEGPEA